MKRYLDFLLALIWIVAVAFALRQPSTERLGGVVPWKTEAVRITDWGPRSTRQDQVFNIQPDGNSAIWIAVSGVTPDHRTRVVFGGAYLERVSVQTAAVTGVVLDDLIARRGWKEVFIVEPSGRKTFVGLFDVLAPD